MPDENDQGMFAFACPVEMCRGALLPAATCEWSTPAWLYEQLHQEFGFTIDVASSEENHRCDRFYTVEDSGLAHSWAGETVWCNPPYDVVSLTDFSLKARAETQANSDTTVVMLVPAKTDQAWWHEVVVQAEVRFIRGRVAFGGLKAHAPMPVVVVVVSQHHPAGMKVLSNRQRTLEARP